MTIERILIPEVPEPDVGLWSNCLRTGDIVYVSGLTSRDKNQQVMGDDEFTQATRVFERIGHVLAAAGASPADVVKLNIYVTRIDKRADVWRARKAFFDTSSPGLCMPVATLVQVQALQPGVLVEIEAVAHVNQGGRPSESAESAQ